MPKLAEVCTHVRSKNAGPFWITIDLFFADRAGLERYGNDPGIDNAAVARIFGVDAARVKRFAIPQLAVLKISYPRTLPQGGALERDMHGGQQYVRLLDIEMAAP